MLGRHLPLSYAQALQHVKAAVIRVAAVLGLLAVCSRHIAACSDSNKGVNQGQHIKQVHNKFLRVHDAVLFRPIAEWLILTWQPDSAASFCHSAYCLELWREGPERTCWGCCLTSHDAGNLEQVTYFSTYSCQHITTGLWLQDFAMGTVEQNMVLRATQLRRTLAKLGASFVKIGQALSARPDLLPKPYLEVS